MIQYVSLAYSGGWKSLHEIRYSVYINNFLKLCEIAILGAILWKIG